MEHSYIEKCLEKVGLSAFIPIFRVLYSDLRSDILINGKIVPGYRIMRGVKQGDALSYILFILCMEPMLRNIEANARISNINSAILNENLPKTSAYADDVNGLIGNSAAAVQELFNEYGRLTNLSGLQLNPEKTEIMRLNKRTLEPITFRIMYLGTQHQIKTVEKTKINGIYFQQNWTEMIDDNVGKIAQRIENQLKPWSRRALTTLGKIQVVKTFGISQIIFLMQSVKLHEKHFKTLNAILYKFIWNRHFLAAKAPERVRREITNKSTKLGGLGMLDIKSLDESIKLKALAKTMHSRHPFLEIVKTRIRLEQFFFPRCEVSVDSVVDEGLRILKNDRMKLWTDEELHSFFVGKHCIKMQNCENRFFNSRQLS